MSDYLMRLICAAILCAVIRAVAGEGKEIRRLICGIFLALTVLSVDIDSVLPEPDIDSAVQQAQAVVREGAEQAEVAQESIITEAFEAYIWNKASELDPALTVRVELAEDHAPERVILKGTVSARAQIRLTQELARELGIGEENVIWIQPHQSSE